MLSSDDEETIFTPDGGTSQQSSSQVDRHPLTHYNNPPDCSSALFEVFFLTHAGDRNDRLSEEFHPIHEYLHHIHSNIHQTFIYTNARRPGRQF